MGAEEVMQSYSGWHHYSGDNLQPPLVLPRRGDAGYSSSVKDWEMQVTPNLIKTERCRLLRFCQRLGDAGYSGSVKDWEMQVTPNLISH